MLRDPHGGFQRHQASLARHHRRAAVADARQEGIDLGFQRITLIQTLLLDGDWQRAGRLIGATLADERQNLLLQIQGKVGVVLENAHLALSFQADAAGGRIDDAPIGEGDARVCDVDVVREHRRADCIDRLYGCADDRLDDVNVMDHQVQNHVHISAPLAIRSQTVALDEARCAQVGLRRQNRRIEPLQVPHLQYQAAARRNRDQLSGFLGGLGDRLLDQHVRARLQEVTRDRKMRRGRCDHAHRVDRAEKLPIIGKRPGAHFGRHGFTGLLSGIDDTHQVTLRRLSIFLGMEPSQVADADHRCSDFPHGGNYDPDPKVRSATLAA